jgi:hypothetical protein
MGGSVGSAIAMLRELSGFESKHLSKIINGRQKKKLSLSLFSKRISAIRKTLGSKRDD